MNRFNENPVIVALDFDSPDAALSCARSLVSKVGLFKIGLQLFVRSGPDIVRRVADLGAKVFLDLKLHDIPTTVEKASAEICRLGPAVRFFTVHSTGGLDMVRAAQRAVLSAGLADKTCVLGVSVLTSITDEAARNEIFMAHPPAQMVPLLAATVKQGGAGGLVCSPGEVAAVRAALGPSLVVVTPGVRPTWAEKGDHAASRVQTPADAMRNGSDYLVIGRPITAHKSPSTAIDLILNEFV